jgi:hypothetical protein
VTTTHDQRRRYLRMTRWQYHWLGWGPLYKFEAHCACVVALIILGVWLFA